MEPSRQRGRKAGNAGRYRRYADAVEVDEEFTIPNRPTSSSLPSQEFSRPILAHATFGVPGHGQRPVAFSHDVVGVSPVRHFPLGVLFFLLVAVWPCLAPMVWANTGRAVPCSALAGATWREGVDASARGETDTLVDRACLMRMGCGWGAAASDVRMFHDAGGFVSLLNRPLLVIMFAWYFQRQICVAMVTY